MFIQSKSTSSTGTTSTTTAVTMTANLTAGNAVVGLYAVNSGSNDLISITDGNGNACTVIDTVLANGDVTYTFYRENITGGASTFTATTNSAWGYRSLVVHEVSEIKKAGALSVHALAAQATPGTGTDAVTSGSVSTTTPNAYVFGAVHVANVGAGLTVTPGTNYTGRESINGGADSTPLESEDRVLVVPGSVAATFTLGVDNPTHTGIVVLHTEGGGSPSSMGIFGRKRSLRKQRGGRKLRRTIPGVIDRIIHLYMTTGVGK